MKGVVGRMEGGGGEVEQGSEFGLFEGGGQLGDEVEGGFFGFAVEGGVWLPTLGTCGGCRAA